MKHTFYAIEIVETGTWAMRVAGNPWYDSKRMSSDLAEPAVYFEEDEEVTDWIEVAESWAREATKHLSTKCRVVALQVTRKGGR